MKKLKLLIIVILFTIMIELVIFPTTSNASFISDAIENARSFLRRGEKNSITYTTGNQTANIEIAYDNNQMKEAANEMFNMLAIVGSSLTIIVGGVLGIQFMMASAEDKAKIKESMLPYVAGLVVIFGAFGIWRMVVIVLQSALK